ncbi:hypothetical protein [Mucilaginibacter gotjawali]|uniref:Uncharacterized protein n=2 Tax=Mucilaginibacter gotjawali TaxID=1550579 RepID=A0A839SGH6_9SPHI|nr:hypothetical protein [Mucilaginibacter gotjawali]MBB3056638.1 hypothetical protein [Mucilaginibacter gotjawali]BAU52659.1 hypothetical protein MgSA37_00821 [Mucilaginibacter gotjawali]
MKTLLNPWFIAGCLVWLIVKTTRVLDIPVPWLNSYLTDFFAVPVITSIGLWLQRVFIIKSNYYVLSPLQVVFMVIYISALFEGLLPLLSKTYTADWVDVFLYCIGGLFFYRVMNKPVLEVRKSGKSESPKENII